MIFWTTLLIVHGLLAVALLGAITHQAVSVWCPVRAAAGSFVARFRAVRKLADDAGIGKLQAGVLWMPSSLKATLLLGARGVHAAL